MPQVQSATAVALMVRHKSTDILIGEHDELVKNYVDEVDIPDSLRDM